jgi:hypothetical protein
MEAVVFETSWQVLLHFVVFYSLLIICAISEVIVFPALPSSSQQFPGAITLSRQIFAHLVRLKLFELLVVIKMSYG